MGAVTIEVSGVDAGRWAGELRGALVAGTPDGSVSAVEVRRSAELVVGVIGLVLAGVPVAEVLAKWWQARRPPGVTVTVLFGDGTRVVVSDVTQAELEITFRQHGPHD